jgi:hypothetical protein
MTECMLANMAYVDLKMVRRQGDMATYLHLGRASLCTSKGCIYRRRECARAAVVGGLSG